MTQTTEPITAGSGLISTSLDTRHAYADEGTVHTATARAGGRYHATATVTHLDIGQPGHIEIAVAAFLNGSTISSVDVSKVPATDSAVETLALSFWVKQNGDKDLVRVGVMLPANTLGPLRDALDKYGPF